MSTWKTCLCIAAASLGLANSPLSAQSPSLPTTRPVTIMPLGDSITEGGGFKVYRYPLARKLSEAGYNVKFVGSKTTAAEKDSPLGALAHEGYGGKNISDILVKLKENYPQHPADILLVHCGHNQFADKGPVPGMLEKTKEIIQYARTVNPKVVVLLAQVITSGKLPKYSYIPEYNAALVKVAADLNTADSPVILVNQAAGFDPAKDTIADTVHPNAQGGEKMAQKWFDALKTVLPAPAPNR